MTSQDTFYIEPWKWCEAFNSFQVLYTRFRLKQAEREKKDVDDLNFLLTRKEYKTVNRGKYTETASVLPVDYFSWNRADIEAVKGGCTKTSFKLYLVEEANVGMYLKNPNKAPSFEWAETLYSIAGNKVRVYTNGEFSVPVISINYYRKPKDIIIEGIEDAKGNLIGVNQDPEFRDDITEILIRGACAIIAGDIEYLNKYQIATQEVLQFT
jgi:hypothetical protein